MEEDNHQPKLGSQQGGIEKLNTVNEILKEHEEHKVKKQSVPTIRQKIILDDKKLLVPSEYSDLFIFSLKPMKNVVFFGALLIGGIALYVASFPYFDYNNQLSFAFITIYILLIFFFSLASYCSPKWSSVIELNHWNFKRTVLYISLILLGWQSAILVVRFVFDIISPLELFITLMGVSWGPTCITIAILYFLGNYINPLGVTHLNLAWLYRLSREQGSFTLINQFYRYFLNDLSKLFEDQLNLMIKNKDELIENFAEELVENHDHLKKALAKKDLKKNEYLLTIIFNKLEMLHVPTNLINAKDKKKLRKPASKRDIRFLIYDHVIQDCVPDLIDLTETLSSIPIELVKYSFMQKMVDFLKGPIKLLSIIPLNAGLFTFIKTIIEYFF